MKALWMFLSSFCFALMGVFTKMGLEHFGAYELVFYRSLVAIVILSAFIYYNKIGLRSSTPSLHLGRSVFGALSVLFFYFSLTDLPIGTSTTLTYSSPLFIALSVLIFSTHVEKKYSLLAAIVVGFTGIVLVAQPTFSMIFQNGIIFGLLSALCSSFGYLYVKQLGKRNEPVARIVFYFSVAGLLLSFLGITFTEAEFSTLNTHNVFYLLGMSVSALLAQCCLSLAYGYGNILLSACLQFSVIVMSEIAGIFLFGDRIVPQVWLGIAVVITAMVFATLILARAK